MVTRPGPWPGLPVLRSESRRLWTLRLQPCPECAWGLGRCCHRELPLLLTDVLFLPRPISEAQAWLRYHCLPCPCSQHCGLQTLTPKGVAVLYCPANRPDLSARPSGGAGREGGVCLLSSLLNIWWENLFRLLAHGSQRSAFLQVAAPFVVHTLRMKGEGRAVKSSVTDQDAVCMSTMYRRRCVTLGTVQVLSVPQFLYLQNRHKECLPPRVILRTKVIHSGCKVTYHRVETWQAEDKEGTGVRLPESKSQLHYLLPVWPGVSHLTSLCLNFLIGKVGII